MSKPAGERYTLAVDFDGVLHEDSEAWIDDVPIGEPVPGAIEWLTRMEKTFDIVILTARASTPERRLGVRWWLHDHGWMNRDINVTNEKPPALVYIDDRAWRFEGRFPTKDEIHAARPWNKPRATRASEPGETPHAHHGEPRKSLRDNDD